MGDTVREFNSDIHLSDLNRYKLLIVEYFDIFTTNTCIGAFILYKDRIKISDVVQYVVNKFVNLGAMDNQWHTQLTHRLKTMKHDPNHNTFVAYQHHSHRGRRTLKMSGYETAITGNSMTLQLSDKHPSFHHDQYPSKNVFLNAYQVCIDRFTQFAKYNVVVCSHEQCPYPVFDWEICETLEIEFEYRRKFTMRQFIQDLLLEPFNPETHYVMASYHDHTDVWSFYEISDIFENHGQRNYLYVFKMKTLSNDANKKKIGIRFVQ
eukprot:335455_1